MRLRWPSPLLAGDTVAVTAPSAGVSAEVHPRLERCLAVLRERGYRVVEGDCLRSWTKGVSAPREQRAAELMRFLLDPGVAAVLPPWGGEVGIDLLERLDFAALAAARPKWFAGFSDLSTLQLPLTLLGGWATLHGPNLMQLGAPVLDATTAAIWQVLAAPRGSLVEQLASPAHESAGTDWRLAPDAGLAADTPTRWRRLDGASDALRLSGRLIGGCLDTLSRLAGTRYGNVPAFVAAAGADGVLLYLENVELRPFECARALHGLRLNGWFAGVAGVLLGRSAAPDAAAPGDYAYLDALRDVLGDLSCPVLYDLDIGHRAPQLSLVNGARAEVWFDDGRGGIRQWL